MFQFSTKSINGTHWHISLFTDVLLWIVLTPHTGLCINITHFVVTLLCFLQGCGSAEHQPKHAIQWLAQSSTSLVSPVQCGKVWDWGCIIYCGKAKSQIPELGNTYWQAKLVIRLPLQCNVHLDVVYKKCNCDCSTSVNSKWLWGQSNVQTWHFYVNRKW